MFEYLTVRLSLFGLDADGERDRTLDRHGAEGWMLVSIVPDGNAHIAYFRRLKR